MFKPGDLVYCSDEFFETEVLVVNSVEYFRNDQTPLIMGVGLDKETLKPGTCVYFKSQPNKLEYLKVSKEKLKEKLQFEINSLQRNMLEIQKEIKNNQNLLDNIDALCEDNNEIS